jgi:hypothetical protein
LAGLFGNASSLGVHWIYDAKYLEKLSKKQTLLFISQEKKHYDASHPSFYVYPESQIGDVSVQGQILLWLTKELEDNPKLTQKQFSQLLYDHFRPGGDYGGYSESYSNHHIFNRLAKKLRMNIEEKPVTDHQLVGFIPYIACKGLNLDHQKAWDLSQVYTQEEVYLSFYQFFDQVMNKTQEEGIQKAIEKSLDLVPDDFQVAFRIAIEKKDIDILIEDYAGRACPIDQALPVIIHILYHSQSFQEALEMNALIGGASSDRGTLLGSLLSVVYDIPKGWKSYIKL